jgi:hypothetical protein
MMQRFRQLLLAVLITAVAPVTSLAGAIMTFEEFADGATNVDAFYGGGVTWLNEEVFNSAGTPALSPFGGPTPSQANVLTQAVCGAVACNLELVSTEAIGSITLSGLIFAGNLEILAFDQSSQVGGALIVDTEFQSVGCAVVTDWSCNRSFNFTEFEEIHRLQFVMTSGSGFIDNVQVFTFARGAVPEPATLALMILGLLGIATARRYWWRQAPL